MRSRDMSQHVVPAGVVVTAILGAIMGWWQLEDQMDARMDEKLAPVLERQGRFEQEMGETEDRQDERWRAMRQLLEALRTDVQGVRETLARNEGTR